MLFFRSIHTIAIVSSLSLLCHAGTLEAGEWLSVGESEQVSTPPHAAADAILLIADLLVVPDEGGELADLRLGARSGGDAVSCRLDYAPEIVDDPEFLPDGVAEAWHFKEAVLALPENADGSIGISLAGEGIASWQLLDSSIATGDAMGAGRLRKVVAAWPEDRADRPELTLTFSRPLEALPPASAFWLVAEDGTVVDRHWNLERKSSREIALLSRGNKLAAGAYSLYYAGGDIDAFGQELERSRASFELAAREAAGAGLAGASLAATSVSLGLDESPAGSGLLTGYTTGSFTSIGRDNSKIFTVELETGDQLSVYVELIEPGADYRLRVLDASGNDIFGGYWGTDDPIQRLDIPGAGTYQIEFWVYDQTTDFKMRVDAGRGTFLEAEDNSSQGAANPLNFLATAAGYQAGAAGALAHLRRNDGWSGTNDVNGDFFALGTINAGNALDVTYQVPDGSSLEVGDIELALFAKGASEPAAISTQAGGLSTTIPTNDEYFLRLAPNDNLDGTSLKFAGGGDYVDLAPEVVDGLDDYTIEFWARGQTDGRGLVSAANSGQDNEILVYLLNGTEVRLHSTGPSYDWTVPFMDEATWRHFAFVRDTTAGTLELFVDGVSMGTQAAAIDTLEVTNFLLGQDQDSPGGGFQTHQAFIGSLEELRVWSTVRTESEINANWKSTLTGGESGLQAYWKFNEGSGGTITDESSAAYSGTLYGPVFDGDVNAAGFNPAKVNIRGQYLASVNVTDSVAPNVSSTSLPESMSTDYVTSFTVTFSEDLDAATATDPAAYTLVNAGPDGNFDTADDLIYTLAPQPYVRGREVVIDLPEGPLQPGEHRLRIGPDVTDRGGNALISYEATFTVERLGDFLIEDLDNDTISTATRFQDNPTADHDASFTARSLLNAGSPLWVEQMDLNDDGSPDIVVCTSSPNALEVYLNDGSGNFTLANTYSLPDEAQSVAVADLNGNSRQDLALALLDDDDVSIFFNTGGGAFSQGPTVSVGNGPYTIATADFDNDNVADLIVSNIYDETLSLLLNDGSGTFTLTTISELSGINVSGLAVGDVDEDGNADVIVGEDNGNRAVFLPGNGDGTFGTGSFIALDPDESDADKLLLTDFDQDGHLDLFVTYDWSYRSERGTLLYGDGQGGFADLTTFYTGSYRKELWVEDVNDDGVPDLLVGSRYWVRHFLGTGDREAPFQSSIRYEEVDDAWGAAVADFDGDGRTDILASSAGANEVFLLTGNSTLRPMEDSTAPGFYQALGRGNLRDRDDIDFFAFSARRGERLMVTADSIGSRTSSGLYYEVFDAGGIERRDFYTAYNGLGQSDPFIIPSDGTYYIRVRRSYDYFGEYRFRVTLAPESYQLEAEGNDRISDATVLSLTQSTGLRSGDVLGQFIEGDAEDYYALGNLATGATIDLTFTNTEDSSVAPKLWIYTEDGTIRQEGAQDATTLAHIVAASGNYFVRVTTPAEDRGFFSEYRLNVEVSDDQPPVIESDTLPAEGSTTESLIIAFSLSFSEDMEPDPINSPANFQLTNAGPDETFGTLDDRSFPVLAPGYSGGSTVTLKLADNPLQSGKYRLVIPAGSLEDLYGNTLASDYVRNFTVDGRPGFIEESTSNDSLAEADSLSASPDSAHDGSLAYQSLVDLPAQPEDIVLEDLDGDGYLDAIISFADSYIRTYPGIGDGSFGAPTDYATSAPAKKLLLADYDANGTRDVIVTTRNGGSAVDEVDIYPNNGDGTLGTRISVTVGDHPWGLASGDFNGDGHLDLIVASSGYFSSNGGQIDLLSGDGNGGFTVGTIFSQSERAYDIEVGDFDEDGDLDIVFSGIANNKIFLMTGNGDGSFAPATEVHAFNEDLREIAVGDLNGDGHLDIAAYLHAHNRAAFFAGNGDGSFGGLVSPYLDYNYDGSIAIADLTDDGALDLIVSGNSGVVHRNGGRRESDGSFFFENRQVQDVGNENSRGLAFGDIDGDGRTDLLTVTTDAQLLIYTGNPTRTLTPVAGFGELRESYGRGRGLLDGETDSDFYVFSGEAGQKVLVAAESDDNSYASHALYLQNSEGQNLESESLHYRSEQMDPVTLPYSGTYYLEVRANSNHDREYRIRISVLDAEVQPETRSNTSFNNPDTVAFTESPGLRRARIFGDGQLEDSDDYYNIGNLAEGAEITATFSQPADSNLTPTLYLLTESGNTIRIQGNPGDTTISYTLAAGEEGEYAVRVYAENRDLFGRYFLDLEIADTQAPEVVGASLPAESASSASLFVNFSVNMSEDLVADLVNDPASYSLVNAGPDNTFATADDFAYTVESLGYSGGQQVNLKLADGPLQPGLHRFTIPQDKFRDLFGNTLESDFTREFVIEGVAGYITESRVNDVFEDADALSASPSTAHDGSFALTSAVSVAEEPRGLVAMDVDGDGDLDALVGGGRFNFSLELLLNDGTGNFAAPVAVPGSGSSQEINHMAGADFDGDGRMDAVYSSGGLVVWLGNNGDGTLSELHLASSLSSPGLLTVADWNGDGAPDVAVVDNGTNPEQIVVFLNDGDGTSFTASTISGIGGGDPVDVAAGHFDADGHLDLVVSLRDNAEVVLFAGDGSGGFAESIRIATSHTNPEQLGAADFDGDGLDDLVVTFSAASFVDIHRRDGDFSFESPRRHNLRDYEYGIALLVDDINDDGLVDIVLGTSRIAGFTVFTGRRGSGFYLSGPQAYEGIDDGKAFATGDFDADGRRDLLVVSDRDDILAFYPGSATLPLKVDSEVVGLRNILGRGTTRNGVSGDYDSDFWTFSALAGDRLLLTTENTSGARLTDRDFYIYGPGGNRLTSFSSRRYGGVGQNAPVTIDYTGRVVVEVRNRVEEGGEYRINANLVPGPAQSENEDNSSTSSANAISFKTQSGERTASIFGVVAKDLVEDHFFLGNLAAGTQIQLQLTLPEDSLLDPRLRIYRDGEPPLAETNDSTPALDASVPSGQSGDYYAVVTGTESTRGFRSTYLADIRLRDTIPPEILSSSLPAAPSAAIFESISLNLSEDFDAATVNDPANYSLVGAGASGAFGDGDDFTVAIGTPAYTNGTSADIPLAAHPLPPGLYRFTVSTDLTDSFGNALTAPFEVTFEVGQLTGFTTETVDDGSGDRVTTLALGSEFPEFASGGARGRIISSDDVDIWQVAGSSGQQLYLDIDFPGSPSSSELEFEVRAPDGSILQSLRSDNYGNLSRVGPIALDQSGDFEIRISQWDSYRGEYRFRASLANAGFERELEPNGSIADANVLPLTADGNERSGSISGFVESTTDRDYFALGEIQAGETIFLSADIPATSPLEPVVSVYDATDTFVGEVSTGRSGDGVGEVSILTTGDYYALVRPSGTSGGLMSEYRLAVQVVPTDSANFANLQVASVTPPSATGISSGDSVSFSYTVENIGADATVATSWIDRVVISTNTIFGDGDDRELAVLTRDGSLASGDAYTVNHSSQLPEGIEGSFYLIVRTDTANQVDEFLFEGDNVLATGGTFNVDLADYPDLVVEQLQISDPGVSGDLEATWQTANRGSLAAANGWTERVQVIDLITQGLVYDNVDSLPQSLAPDETVARSLDLAGLPASNYRLRITTDYGDDYFEYDTDHAGAEENTLSGDFLVYRYFDLSVAADPAEGGSVSGGGTYREDSTVTVTAAADTSSKPYRFVRWKNTDGTFLTTNENYTFTAEQNAVLVAEFELPLYTLDTSQNIAAGGSVSGAGGYRWGATAILTARPAPGYLFEAWESAATGTELGTTETLALTVDGDLAARAVFAEENPTHDVTVVTSPADVATLSGGGSYNNGDSLNLRAPATVVDGETEYLFQQWTLNGENYAGSEATSITFATTQPAILDFVAEYDVRSYLPTVVEVDALQPLNQPVPADALFGFTLTFDRAMNTAITPTLSFDSADASSLPTISGGQWIDDRRWESGTLIFVSENTGSYALNVADAEGQDGRVMAPGDVVNFEVDATPPANPAIALQGTGTSTATIEWSAYAAPGDLKNFRVYLKQADFSETTPAGAVSALGAGAREFTFSSLDLDQDYFAAIVAVDQAGNADPQVTPLPFSIDSEVPPPVAISLQRDAPDSALLDWSGYNSSSLAGFAGFHVYRSTSDFSDVSAMTPVATLPADATEYRTASLDRAQEYYFAVVGFNRLDEINPAVTTVAWTDPLAGVISADLTFGGEGQAEIDVLQSIVVRDGATLTLRPGTTLRFAPGTGFAIEEGRLDAVGSAFEPIVLTSGYDRPNPPQNPSAGDWLGVELLDATTASALEHVWILYAQGILLDGADPQFSAVGAVRNAGAGLTVAGGSSLTGDALYLAFNDIGLAAMDTGSAATITGSVLLNNASWAAQSAADASIEASASWWGTAAASEVGALLDGPVQAPNPLAEEPLLGLDFALARSTVQTTNDQVDLRLATMNASALRLSEDSTFAGTPFEDLHDASAVDTLSYAAYERSFTLSEGAGVKTIFAEFLSPTGGLTETLQLQIELLADGPEITGFNLSEGQVINRPLDVVASAASPVGIAELRFEVDGSPELSSPADVLTERWNVAPFESGLYRLRLVAEDLSGNIATQSINVTIDPAPPNAPVIDQPANNAMFTVDTTTVSGTAEPDTEVRLTVNGGTVASGRTDENGAFSFSAVALDEGRNEIIVIAEDAAGSSSSAMVNVVSDTQSPQTVAMEEPVYDPDTGLILQWRYLETEGERPVEFKVYWATSSFSDPADALAAGDRTTQLSYAFAEQANQRYYFRVVGYDAADNASVLSDEVSFVFDDTPPVMEIFYDKSMPVGSGDLQITLKSNEALNSSPSLTIQPEGRRLPISVPLASAGTRTWTADFGVSDASMRSGEASVLVTARDEDNNVFSGAPNGPALRVDLTRPTGVLRINELEPVQVLDPRQIELTLELSEAVAQGTMPSLRWSPPSGAEVEIALEGSEDRWTGELTLFPTMGKGEGTFLLEATDAVGNTGTLLTEGGQLEIYNTTLPDPPARPGQLAAATRAAGEIDLEWLPAEKGHTYNLYRVPAGQAGIPNNLVEEGINGTTYTDLPPSDGQYRYVVTASRLGAEGEPSPAFTVTSDRTPPQPPQNALAQIGLSGVEVSFDAPAGGETPARYVLYRNGAATTVSRSMPVTLRDYPPRGVMEYQVASSDIYGNHALSNSSTIEMFLAPVKDLDVLVEPGEPVRLTWASNDAATVGYHLYRNNDTPQVVDNSSLLNNSYYIDPLSLGGSPVTYAVTAVDDQGRESVRRQLTVQPLVPLFLLNPDADDEEFPSVARYFDRYAFRLKNASGNAAVALSKILVERTLSNGDSISREFADNTSVPGAGEASTAVVVPAPLIANLEQTVQLTLETEADTGGGKVRYRIQRVLPGAESPEASIRLAPVQPPLAGGTTDFEVTFINRGRTEADFVLTRENGAEAGEFAISVLNDADQEVAFNPLQGILGGMQFNGGGDGFLRLAPGESASVSMPSVFVPEALGDSGSARFIGELVRLYYKTGDDAEQSTGPLSSEFDSNLVETSYYATSSTPRAIYSDEETIVISGQSLDRETDAPVGNKDLRLGFSVQGFRFDREVTTDAEGDYSFEYNPSFGIAGEIEIWAAHPEVIDQLDQTSVTLYRSLFSPARGAIKMSKNDFLDFDVQLINPGNQPLSDFSLDVSAYVIEEDGSQTPISSVTAELREPVASPVGSRSRAPVKLRLLSDLDAPDNAVVEITLTSSEGASSTFVANTQLLPAIPVLSVVSPRNGYVDLTVDRGEIESRQVTITNRGLRPLEDVVLTPPEDIPWMQVNLARDEDGNIRLPDLEVGESLTFGVAYTPPEETPVGFYDDFILISGSNAVADFRLNLFAQVNADAFGDVQFAVDNNLVQAVPNASVRLRNVTLGIERGPRRTDANGEVIFEDLQAGKWSWKISAPSHQSRAGVIDVIPGQTNGVTARLGKSLVSINFNVVPVPFTDRYEIKLEQTFETRVPAPVVTLTPPQFEFETDQPFETSVVFELTNHGLVSGFNNEITAVKGGRLRIVPLIEYIPEIRAQETIEIPAKIIFDGFEETTVSGGGLETNSSGASPAAVGGGLPGGCSASNDGEFLEGIAAIAKIAADGEFECADGDLGAYAAVALASASAYTAATSVTGSLRDLAISLVGNLISCAKFDTSPGDPGGEGDGGPPPHKTSPNPGSGGAACFVAGTEVRLADGSVKAIEQLRAGDALLTGSGGSTATIQEAFVLSAESTLAVYLADGSLAFETTPAHRIWVDGEGWKPAAQLEAGDWLEHADGSFRQVGRTELSERARRVYTLQLKTDNAFFANGWLVQDLCGGLSIPQSQLQKLEPLSEKGVRP